MAETSNHLILGYTKIADLFINSKLTKMKDCNNTIEESKPIRLKIPGYQRPYKWSTKNACQLVDDIEEAFKSNKEIYRVGTLILHEEKIKNDSNQSGFVYNIVDGQQRTITFLLLLKCCFTLFETSGEYSEKDFNDNTDAEETMECNIYTCTSCGAEVAINNVEASTFCSFCGQPTVVFNRVASQKKPKYIIPFSVTKERAISRIREKLNSGFFVPAAIKNFEIERVRGIYIPFWLYDIYYHDSQYLKGTVGSGKNSHTYYYFREADCEFVKLTLDASWQLNDESSQRLEPYYTKDMKDFSLEYLSGFYADTYDVNTTQLESLAVSRARGMFQDAVEKTIEAHDILVLKKDPDYKILKTEYAMFPAWFLTFRYEDVPYTLLVNGQTEKIIGGVPYDRTKVAVSFAIAAVILSILSVIVLSFLLLDPDSDESVKIITAVIVFGLIGLVSGINNFKTVKESATLTSLSETNNFVKNRGK